MREPYLEGVANHEDPESCVGVREGDGEALTGALLGWVLGREITATGRPTPLIQAEGHTGSTVIARCCLLLRGRRPHARQDSFCTEAGRSLGCTSLRRRAASERPEAVTR